MLRESYLMQTLARRFSSQREDGAAMIFALIVAVVGFSIAMIVATYSLTSIVSTRSLNYYVNFNAAVQTALSNAKTVANTPNGAQALYNARATSCNAANAVTGSYRSDDSNYKIKWSWYTERVVNNSGSAFYYVHAFGYSTDCTQANARHIRITLNPLLVSSACYENGANGVCNTASRNATDNEGVKLLQSGTSGAVFNYGLLGVTGATLGTSSGSYPIVRSYKSSQNVNPAANGDLKDSTLATNGVFNLGSSSTNLNTFLAFDGASCNPTGDSTACSSVNNQKQQYTVSIASLGQDANLAGCTSGSPWVASANIPLMANGCYSSLTFDANTTVTSATKVYTYGSINVTPGAKVNANGIPSNLQIYSSGSSCTFQNGTSSSNTVFKGLIAGQSLSCADSNTANPSGELDFYGGLAVNSFSFTSSNTNIWVDDDAKNLVDCKAITSGTGTTAGCTNVRQLWYQSDYRSFN